MQKNNIKKLKQKISYEKEMKEHYKDLYKIAFQENKFNGLQKTRIDDLLCEVHDFIKKGINPKLIEEYIENGRQKICIMQSIHYDETT